MVKSCCCSAEQNICACVRVPSSVLSYPALSHREISIFIFIFLRTSPSDKCCVRWCVCSLSELFSHSLFIQLHICVFFFLLQKNKDSSPWIRLALSATVAPVLITLWSKFMDHQPHLSWGVKTEIWWNRWTFSSDLRDLVVLCLAHLDLADSVSR